MTIDITPTPSVHEVALAREIAEGHLADAKTIADKLRVRNAKIVLEQAFPDHTMVVFGRYWDETEVKLMQVLGSSTGADFDDIHGDEAQQARMTTPQLTAWTEASRLITRIGSDDELYAHLEYGSEEHADWYEFDLRINDARDLDGTESALTSEQKETP